MRSKTILFAGIVPLFVLAVLIVQSIPPWLFVYGFVRHAGTEHKQERLYIGLSISLFRVVREAVFSLSSCLQPVRRAFYSQPAFV